MPVGLSYFQRRRIFQPPKKKKKKTTGSKPKVLELGMSPPPLKRLFGTIFCAFMANWQSVINYIIKAVNTIFMRVIKNYRKIICFIFLF